jgi:two-component system cell cycle sensor histidine kinase/response regulator CckA
MEVLIVDDKPQGFNPLESILRESGYEVVLAANGKEALVKLRSRNFHLIISDILMPVMDGLQLCKECKRDEKLKEVPFIFYTAAYRNEEDLELGVRLGADAYVLKPIDQRELMRIIHDVLTKPKEKRVFPQESVWGEEVLKPYSEPLVQKLEKKVLELQKLEKIYCTLCENLSDATFSLGEEGYFTAANNQMQRFGYVAEDVIGKHFGELLTPQSREVAKHHFENAKKGVSSRDVYEVEIVQKDGSIALAELNMSTIYMEGKFFGRFGIARDITERKRMEEELRQNEKRYRLLAENVLDIIWTSDLNSRFTYISPSVERFRGFKSEEVMDRTWMEILTPASLELAKKVFAEEMAIEDLKQKDLSRSRTLELEQYCRDGSTFWMENKISFLRDPDGRPIGILGVARDITERKRVEKEVAALQAQLHQAQKMEAIGQLAGGFAHDFNNALTLIKASSQLALFDLKEGDPLRENIEMILGATDRSANLARQLLAFSRRQVMQMKVLDVNALLKELDKMLRRVIGEDIKLVNVLAKDLGRVKADPGQIEQVILNLALNARDAMSMGGKLTIETANAELDEEYVRTHAEVISGKYVMLAVSDTGVGMTPEVKEQIFQPFFTTKEKGLGTGLGLSSVYGIVRQSDGHMWVYSEPGKGSTFKIYLPRVEEVVETEKIVTEKEIPRGGETVLVAEDERDVRILAIQILKRQGYKILEAANGGEALLICEKHRGEIHLMLTDIVMPGMSGRELAERLLQLHPEMKVLYMSGYPYHAVMRHGILGEEPNFIQKPFSLQALVNKVREVLDQKER